MEVPSLSLRFDLMIATQLSYKQRSILFYLNMAIYPFSLPYHYFSARGYSHQNIIKILSKVSLTDYSTGSFLLSSPA